jgi:asparagine synthase (glutamine-hydrolysing)
MCGIAGWFDPRPAPAAATRAAAAVRAMAATLAHRGPDDDGLWVDARGRCVLGHRRLAVIDPSPAGRQPMVSADGRWVVAQNGEIYNYRDLRPAVERAGLRVRGRTDTEVLLHGLALWGVPVLDRLDGMYAFAAFDVEAGELWLARDPFGEKPLYYCERPDGVLAFASELQALERLPGFDGEVNPDAVAEVLTFQYIGSPRTIYRSVRKLAPGHWLRVAPGGPARIAPFWSFEPVADGAEGRSTADLADELEDLLARSIERRLVADVPVGAFLSGGVDSSTVCALARRKLGRELKAFTIGFEDAAESEHPVAQAFARHLGLDHHVRVLAPDATELLKDLGALLDEPNADWSCLPVYLLAGLAREHVTVALSGDGGDEMFAGYEWYFAPLEQDRGAPWRADDAYMESLLMTDPGTLARLLGEVPDSLRAQLGQLRDGINEPGLPLVFRIRRNEVRNYLPGAVLAKVDRMSMRHSLEVRAPFLDRGLARFAASLSADQLYGAGRGKRLLREVAYRHLPRALVDRPKSGFGLPGAGWAAVEIRSVAQRLLGGEESRLRHWLGPERLDAFVAREPDTHRQWALAMLESWLRHHPARLSERRGG